MDVLKTTEQLQARMKYWDKGFLGDVLAEDEIKPYWQPSEDSK